MTLISETAAEVVYPTDGYRTRAHRTLSAPDGDLPTPVAAEFLSSMFLPDQDAGYLVLHYLLPGTPDLATISNLLRALTNDLDSILSPLGLHGFTRTGRIANVSHVVREQPLPELLPESIWSVEDQWMYYLTAADTPERNRPDPDKPSLLASRVRLSQDWTALVMRDGMAMLALTPISCSPFHDFARIYARSVYLDAFLLGLIQRDAAQHLHREAAHAMANAETLTPATPEKLERSLLAFRSRLWSMHVVDRGGNVDDITRAVQAQFHLPELVAALTTNLTEIARFMQARATRRREQVTWLLGLVTAAVIVPSFVFSSASALADPSPRTFVACVVISILLLVGIWVAWRRYGDRWISAPSDSESP